MIRLLSVTVGIISDAKSIRAVEELARINWSGEKRAETCVIDVCTIRWETMHAAGDESTMIDSWKRWVIY